MNSKKKKWIDFINEVLDNKKNRLTKKSREKLIIIREEIKNAKTWKAFREILEGFLPLVTIGKKIFIKHD